MKTEAPHVGQIRQRAEVETTVEGDQRITDVTTEAWTGAEWVDVRALAEAHADRIRLIADLRALAEELEGQGEFSGPAKGAAYRIAADRIRLLA